jgi:hypothetical protein
MTDKLELEFWLKVKTIRDMNLKVDNIKKEDKKKKQKPEKL